MHDRPPDPGRRRVIRAGGALVAGAVAGSTSAALGQPAAPFPWGVASFDPTPDAVLLWTRVDVSSDGPVTLDWVLAADPELTEPVASGTVEATAATGHCVTVDATGLRRDSIWWYRFSTPDGTTSPVGRTRTMPTDGADRLRLAVASCGRYASGGFAAYGALAHHEVHLVVHVGDYIYEDGRAGVRAHVPATELVELADYRARYAQHRLDPHLQALHARHPVVAVWDDHEVAGNAWRDGAATHRPSEHGPWIDRLTAAGQAHEEWLPGRTGRSEQDGRLRAWRSLSLGPLAELVVLDTRTWGRDRQPDRSEDLAGETADEHRSMLGADQMEFVASRLAPSPPAGRAPWVVLVSQVAFHPMEVPVPSPTLADDARAAGFLVKGDRAVNPDQWDGYPTARAQLARAIGGNGGVVVVSGDLHSSWAWEGPANDGGRPSMVEVVAPSVSSEPLASRLPTTPRPVEVALAALNPDLSYVELSSHGYAIVDLTADDLQAEWWYLNPNGSASARFAAGRTAPRAVPMHLTEVSEPRPDLPHPRPDTDPTEPAAPSPRPGSTTGTPWGGVMAVGAAAGAAVLALRRRRGRSSGQAS